MGIVDRVKRVFGRGGGDDPDDGMDADEVARRTKGEDAERAYERVNADLEQDRNKAYERLTDVDGGRYG
jgi:hypothetical protein